MPLCKFCKTNASFNYKGEKPIVCSAHKELNMINVTAKYCLECETYAGFNYKGIKKPLYCNTHKKDGMVPVTTSRICQFVSDEGEKCESKAYYNFYGEKKPLMCPLHKEDKMINVEGCFCEVKDCGTHATFNYKGETRPRFCGSHKTDGMCDVVSKRCETIGCGERAIYNYKNTRGVKYCFDHKKLDMVSKSSKRCEECKSQALFNFPNEKSGRFCEFHKKDGMVNIRSTKCQGFLPDGKPCQTQPSFNFKGEKAKFCIDHKEKTMINVLTKRCTHEDCGVYANFGYPHEVPTRCSNHVLENMIMKPRKKCIYHDLTTNKKCRELAIYGYKNHIMCEQHKEENMLDFLQKRCSHCGFIDIVSQITNQCSNCDEFFRRKVRNVKESEIKDFLDRKGFTYISHDKSIQWSDLKYRPDFLFENKKKEFYVIVEVDEEQHRHNPENCECVRMVNISQELAKPTIFIRYNPDVFKAMDKNGHQVKKNIGPVKRKTILSRWLETILNYDIEQIRPYGYLSYLPLFYDGFSENNMQFITIHGWDD